jgi:hypothetical protein
MRRAGLAPDDLRHPLVAHAHDLGDGLHGQALAVSRTDGFVPLLPQGFAGLLQGCFAFGVVLGEGGQTGSGLWGLAFRSGDLKIV